MDGEGFDGSVAGDVANARWLLRWLRGRCGGPFLWRFHSARIAFVTEPLIPIVTKCHLELFVGAVFLPLQKCRCSLNCRCLMGTAFANDGCPNNCAIPTRSTSGE